MLLRKKTLTSLPLIMFFTLAAWRLCFAQTPTPTPAPAGLIPVVIQETFKQPLFPVVFLGSLIGWMVGKVKGFVSAKEWLDRYWPGAPLPVIFLLDLFIFAFVGSFLGTLIYSPTSALEALAAGVSWPVGLGGLATKE
jgi:hypothetical protein